jgi:hypothetical protein
MKIEALVSTCLAFLLVAGCSSGDEQTPARTDGDHVWKEQVDTMDKARAAEQAVMDAAAKQAEAIEQQTE